MLNTKLTTRLKKFLAESEMLGIPATAAQIAAAEKQLNTKLPDDYVDFISHFGGAYAGIAIHAFENANDLGNETVTDLTLAMRESIATDDDRHAEAMQSIAFSDDGGGNPLIINAKGEVVIYYHDSDGRKVLAPTLGKYIEDNFEEW